MTASPDPTRPLDSTYDELIVMLNENGVDFELLNHAPAGVTGDVSRLRGHPVEQAAKCLLLMVKLDRRNRKYVLAVVPGDSKVDFGRVADHYEARYVGFCDPATAQQLARAVPGTVLPFKMDSRVELLVDPRVLDQPRLYFNAARLDRSVSMFAADYSAIAQPAVLAIAQKKGTV